MDIGSDMGAANHRIWKKGFGSMKSEVQKYLASIGARGGKAGTGKSKARTKAQAQKAALARWRKPANDKLSDSHPE